MATPKVGQDKESEYHHFVPQFILRKYSNYARPSPTTGLDKKQQERKIKKAKEKARATILDLKTNPGSIEQRKTNNIFGEQDMYRTVDPTDEDRFEIEKKLSALEQRASKIIEKIEDDHSNCRPSTEIGRADKDELRRFLFIMLYRNRSLYGRYDKSSEEYDAADRNEMLKYMKEKRFSSPRHVWLANLKAFLNVRMGPDIKRWSSELMANSFPMDAGLFTKHLLGTFLSFCTPEDIAEEFVLTENAYSIFEGPVDHQGWADWHVFAPVNPRLLIVMRQQDLQPITGVPEELKSQFSIFQEETVARICSLYQDPLRARSCLADLPVGRPQTNYDRFDRGRATLADREPCFRKEDNFTFKFFVLTTKHVQLINSLFLEEAYKTRAVVFKTKSAFLRAVEAYLRLDLTGFKLIERQGHYRGTVISMGPSGLKISRGSPIDERGGFLKLLETVSHNHGSSTKAKYESLDAGAVEILPPIPSKFLELYFALIKLPLIWLGIIPLTQVDGDLKDPRTLLHDLGQANRIVTLRTRSDAAVNKLDDQLKYTMQKHRRDLITSLPPRRVWLYLRQLRVMTNLGPRYSSQRRDLVRFIVSDNSGGPEDRLVTGNRPSMIAYGD
jgi:Protein of unknown function (DUF4238)